MKKLIFGLVAIAASAGVVLFLSTTNRLTCALTITGGDVVARRGPCLLNFGGGVLLRDPQSIALVVPLVLAIACGLLVLLSLLVTLGRRR